jgi:hypothetical protein
MLDAFIIEELRRREEREIGQVEQPRMEMPRDDQRRERLPPPSPEEASEGNPSRGVIVIDF